MWVLKSERSQEFVNFVSENLYKKRRLRKDKFLDYKVTPVRYSLSDIRSGTLRNKMQNEIKARGFECKLPTTHIMFGGKQITDEETGEAIYTKGCEGKIIAEKIPRVMYHFDKKSTIKYILVREHERALFTKDGRILTVLEAGKHDIINRSTEFEIIEIYYVDVGDLQSRWGTSTMLTDGKGTMTATQVRLRLNGSFTFRINNINNFLTNIVKNETEYYEGNLSKFVKDKILEIINSEMSQAEPISIYQDAEKVMLAVKVKANDLFQETGIELRSLAVSSCKFDEEVEQMFKDRLREIKVGGAGSDADTNRKLQELKALKEMGVDVSTYVSKEQDIKMAAASPGGASEKEKIKAEIAELEKKIDELDEKLDAGEMSESVWEKRMDRLEGKIKDLKKKLYKFKISREVRR